MVSLCSAPVVRCKQAKATTKMSAKKKKAAGGDDAEVVTDDAAGDSQDNLSDADSSAPPSDAGGKP